MFLKTLSELNAASGAEKPVRETLRQTLEPHVDRLWIDKMGNLIAEKNTQGPGAKVMLAAHLDEVALMVTEVTAEGFLKFSAVGGIDARILPAKIVKVGEPPLHGVIGSKAVHLTKAVDRQKGPEIEQLCIDIGAKSKEDAMNYVKPGDYAYFATEFEPFGQAHWKGKALDDRVGCYILTEILKRNYPFPVVGVFTVQEEVGLRGAKVAAFHVQPDFAIVIEGTVSADMMDVGEQDWVTGLGKGPACSVMDHATIYSPELIRQVAALAKVKGIPLQFRRGSSGGNDAGAIHLAREGVPSLSLSIPCRYIHSFASVVADSDIIATVALVEAIVRDIPASMPSLSTAGKGGISSS